MSDHFEEYNKVESAKLMAAFQANLGKFEAGYANQFPVVEERRMKSLAVVGALMDTLEKQEINLAGAVICTGSLLLTLMHEILKRDKSGKGAAILKDIGTRVEFN